MMGIEETDPRWVGAWWLGFQVVCVLGALGVFPLLILPKVLPESLKWHRYGRKLEDTVGYSCHTVVYIVVHQVL